MLRTVHKTLVPKMLAAGAPGTQKLLERYGEALVCMRYRDDTATGTRLKTVELIVDRKPLVATECHVRIRYAETDLRRQVGAHGGTWDGQRKL